MLKDGAKCPLPRSKGLPLISFSFSRAKNCTRIPLFPPFLNDTLPQICPSFSCMAQVAGMLARTLECREQPFSILGLQVVHSLHVFLPNCGIDFSYHSYVLHVRSAHFNIRLLLDQCCYCPSTWPRYTSFHSHVKPLRN
jgi:hypothetical protein